MQFIICQWKKLTETVQAVQKRIVKKIGKARRREIFVIVEAGVVHEIINLPSHLHVTVIDYDVESVDEKRLEISPVDGELCFMHKW
jgi:hypothetical protein